MEKYLNKKYHCQFDELLKITLNGNGWCHPSRYNRKTRTGKPEDQKRKNQYHEFWIMFEEHIKVELGYNTGR